MSVQQAAMRGVPVVLQSAGAATANGVILAIPDSFREHIFTIVGSSGVASGAVQIETADDPAYAGTWAPQGAAVTVVADTEKSVNLSGIFPFLRCRISTIVAGGTVTVTYKGS